MDFIESLPLSQGVLVIFVIVEKLTKYAHFVSLSHFYTTTTVANVFICQIFKLHGMPTTIVTSSNVILFNKTFL